jgi:hypothetical protein
VQSHFIRAEDNSEQEYTALQDTLNQMENNREGRK